MEGNNNNENKVFGYQQGSTYGDLYYTELNNPDCFENCDLYPEISTFAEIENPPLMLKAPKKTSRKRTSGLSDKAKMEIARRYLKLKNYGKKKKQAAELMEVEVFD